MLDGFIHWVVAFVRKVLRKDREYYVPKPEAYRTHLGTLFVYWENDDFLKAIRTVSPEFKYSDEKTALGECLVFCEFRPHYKHPFVLVSAWELKKLQGEKPTYDRAILVNTGSRFRSSGNLSIQKLKSARTFSTWNGRSSVKSDAIRLAKVLLTRYANDIVWQTQLKHIKAA